MKRLTSPKHITGTTSEEEFVPVTSSLLKSINKTHHLGSVGSGVRDAIIRVLERDYADQPFTKSFICHIKKIGVDKLDNYSEIEFKLTQFGARLVFKLWLPLGKEPEEMTYTLPDLSLDPDERLLSAPKPFSLFGFRFA
jgi:hypothetical protein